MASRTTEEDSEVTAIVNDYLSYQLLQNGYQWSCPPLRPPSKVSLSLRSVADELKTQYTDTFSEMCERLNLSPATLCETFLGVANELFNGEIKWARIVALFVFSSELANYCKDRQWPHLINEVAHMLKSYITSNLLQWINDHGGWEGLIVFAGENQPSESPWPGLKSLVCGVAASALGALTLGAILTSRS